MSDFQPAPLVPRASKQAKMLGVAVDDLPSPSSPLSPLSTSHGGPYSLSPGLAAGSQYPAQAGASGLEGWNGWAAPHVGAAVDSGHINGAGGASATHGIPLNRIESGVSPFASTSSIPGQPRASLDVGPAPFPLWSDLSLSATAPDHSPACVLASAKLTIPCSCPQQTKRKTSILPLVSPNAHLRGSRSAAGLRSSTSERDTSQSGTGRKRGLFGGLLKRKNSKGDKGDGESGAGKVARGVCAYSSR